MAKTKGPDLADFAVHLYGHHPLKIRATSLIILEKWLYLRDAGGNILFAAPEPGLHYVKRLEPGEEPAVLERLPEPGLHYVKRLEPGEEPAVLERLPEPEPARQEVPETGPLFTAIIEPVAVDPPPPAEVVADEIPGVGLTEVTEDKGTRRRGTGGRFAK